jgi:phospholipid transport system substrate-binding protein
VIREGAAVVLVALVATAPPAAAGAPTDALRPAIEQVMRIRDDPKLRPVAMTRQRHAALRGVIEAVLDVPEAARRALGPYWRERTDPERAEFVALFRELVMHAYLTPIDLYDGEKVLYLAESRDDGSATVRTRLVSRRRPELGVDYRLHQAGARWLVYDVNIEGASLVANYRAQFTSIIQTSSYAELVRRIERRVAEIERHPAATIR